ncbi:hypothetical protein M413DRAFT_447852, partial [Hebeloma cylindrosporum]
MLSPATSAGYQPHSTFEPVRFEPPSVLVFNVGRRGAVQTDDGPAVGVTFLESFINVLQNIKDNGYILQGQRTPNIQCISSLIPKMRTGLTGSIFIKSMKRWRQTCTR